MRYYKRLNEYKASNVRVKMSPLHENIEAYSYNWWLFVKRIKGKLVFNDYRYSVSTGGHQRKVLALFSDLGIHVDYFIECPGGLQNLKGGIEHYNRLIEQNLESLGSSRTRVQTREHAIKALTINQKTLEILKWLAK